MKNFDELKNRLAQLQQKFGQKYFICIAPIDLKKCNELKIFENYVYKKTQPPDSILDKNEKLDIYFVEYKYISGMRSGQPLAFHRLSTTNIDTL
jgi:hypothetical protein